MTLPRKGVVIEAHYRHGWLGREDGLALVLRRPDGVLALHLSNRQLDLLPVARAAADALSLEASLIDTNDDGEGCWGATWVLLAREAAPLEPPEIDEVSADLPESPRVRLWTDDYSNLFQVLK